MPVNLVAPDPASLHAVPGIQLGAAQAGIRKPGRFDLLVLSLIEGSSVAGVFTRNRFCAAPVQVCREHLDAAAGIRALVVNTGNANAGTGADGLARATKTPQSSDDQWQRTDVKCDKINQDAGMVKRRTSPGPFIA